MKTLTSRELQTRKILGVVLTSLVWLALFPLSAAGQPPKARNALPKVQSRHRDRYREFSNEITKLEDQCTRNELTDAAAQVHARLVPPDTLLHRMDKLPSSVQPEIPVSLPEAEREWRIQLRKIERDYAKDLYLQANWAVKQGFHSYAYDLVREAAFHDPDNMQARKILGYVRNEDKWVNQAAHSLMKKRYIWHEDFGWLPKEHKQKYIDGERFVNSRWISAEKENEIRRDFNSAWEIRTDHYLIKTNVSLEKGVELGKALEEFYEVFQETFAGFFHTPEQLKILFAGAATSARAEPKPYTVHFYRTKEEYFDRLRIFFPNIEQTNGVYMTSDRVAHFYEDPENDRVGTMYHEGTHQLFYESCEQNRTICENHHFWIVEGIACYMESFQPKKGSMILGDPKYIRFAGARHNLIREGYYVPLREFSEMGMQDFRSAPSLAKNYSQSAGLARFFMHYDDGRYRDALVSHLAQLYSNDMRKREQAEGLDQLTGVDFEELDRQYAEDARK